MNNKKKSGKKLIWILLTGFLMTPCLEACGKEKEDFAYVQQLGPGWNLGNSLEAFCEDGSYAGNQLELYWQNPVTTKAMIHEVRKAGFTTLRIPVTWEGHMDAQGRIDKVWLDRVKEVVDYGMSNDMDVILNAHHDRWFEPTKENEENAVRWMKCVWRQVGEYFMEYDSRLLFEGMNEPRWIGSDEEWRGGSEETAAIVNRLNQVFVDTIRGQGGNNRERYLLVTTYGGSIEERALKYFVMPEGKHLIVTVHAYTPYDFAMNPEGSRIWKETQVQEIEVVMERLMKRFVSKGIPVLIGEFGAIDKKNAKERLMWVKDYTKAARESQIAYIWWDEGGPHGETYERFRIFDREKLVWLFPEIRDALTERQEE